MKRLLILATAAVLVLGWAAATYAEIDFGASGFVRVRSKWGVNSGNAPRATAGDFDKTEAWMDTRFRLRFAAKANDYATGVIYFEGDSSRWGEREVPIYLANHGLPAGTNSFVTGGARNRAGVWNSDRTAVELKQFYIDFKVPGLSDFAPTNVKAGIQGFSVRSHALLFADGPGVEVNTTAGPVKFNLYWYKPEEGSDWKSDDADIYGAQVWVPGLLPVTPGGYILYLNANNYPLRSATAVAAPGPPVSVTETYPAELFQADLFWIGAYVDGKIGPVALKTDFIYSGGDVEARSAAVAAGFGDVDFSGWMFFADACYTIPMEMAIDVGGTFMYATGNDVTDLDFDGYVVPPGSEEPYIGAWGIVYYASGVNDGTRISNLGAGAAAAYGKAGGTWFAKLYGGVKPLDWLKVHAYGMYIGDTTDDGNTVGNAVDAVGLPEDDSDIGIELGTIVDFQIYKNLTYSIGAGILFAGDALETVDAAGVNQDPDDPWAIVSQLIFKF